MVFGEDLLPLLLIALGGAMAVGSAVALVRPPERRAEGDLERPPLGRSLVMIVLGSVTALWALASLVAR